MIVVIASVTLRCTSSCEPICCTSGMPSPSSSFVSSSSLASLTMAAWSITTLMSAFTRSHPICRNASIAAIDATKTPPKKQSAAPKTIWIMFIGSFL